MKKQELGEKITSEFVKQLEQGVAPWAKSWKISHCMPFNFKSQKHYQGFNALALMLQSLEKGYESGQFGTFKQWKEYKEKEGIEGPAIQKGEKGHYVFFYSIIDPSSKKKGDSESQAQDHSAGAPVPDIPASKNPPKKSLIRCYSVFNRQQAGLPLETEKNPFNSDLTLSQKESKALEVLQKYWLSQSIEIRKGAPRYNISQDTIYLPDRQDFKSNQTYIATAFHESAHSTGAKKRLDRFPSDLNSFGLKEYALEELCAELTAAFCCASLRLSYQNQRFENYLDGWIKQLKADSQILFKVSANAQKAMNFIL